MEREDPLERLERKENERKAGGNLKIVMIVMAVCAAVLAAALVIVLTSKNKLVNQLNEEKSDLAEQIQMLQSDYEGLSSDYDSINAQLDSSREEIAQLVERVKNTEATNRRKIRQYEKELGTLRTIMRSYIVQIDSLNTLNHKLTAEAASARKEAAVSKKLNAELSAQVEDLTGRVSAGAVLKARGLRIEAFNASDKLTDRSGKVKRMLVTLSLLENELTRSDSESRKARRDDTKPRNLLLSDTTGTEPVEVAIQGKRRHNSRQHGFKALPWRYGADDAERTQSVAREGDDRPS